MQMPSSAVVTLSDPDEYAAAFRNAKVEITVIGRGQFTAERPYLEHIGTLSHKSAGGIDRGFFRLKYLHNAIATSVTMGKIPW